MTHNREDAALCKSCGGQGTVMHEHLYGSAYEQTEDQCADCAGTGLATPSCGGCTDDDGCNRCHSCGRNVRWTPDAAADATLDEARDVVALHARTADG